MLSAEPDTAAGDHPDHERDARRPAHHEAELRGLIHDLVEGDAGEVRELKLDHGPQPRQGGADPAPDEAALRQRRVADPLGAVALVETLGGAKEPAHPADVLADHDHARIGLELELERLAHGGDEAERPLGLRDGSRVAFLEAEHRGQKVVGARVLVRERELDRALDPRRWRTNVHVALDAPAFAEEDWEGRTLAVGAATLTLLHPCERCVIPTRDPDTQEKAADLLRHLFRVHGGRFGLNARADGPARIRVGDPVALS